MSQYKNRNLEMFIRTYLSKTNLTNLSKTQNYKSILSNFLKNINDLHITFEYLNAYKSRTGKPILYTELKDLIYKHDANHPMQINNIKDFRKLAKKIKLKNPELAYKIFKEYHLIPYNENNKLINKILSYLHYKQKPKPLKAIKQKRSIVDEFIIGGHKSTCKTCENNCYIKDNKGYILNLNTNQKYSIITTPHETKKCNKQSLTGKFKMLPNQKDERDCIYISGPSGAGKSTFAGDYLKEYKKIYPNNQVLLISKKPLNKDVNPNSYKHIEVTKEFINKIKIKDLKNSLLIFDDIENISNSKEDLKLVYNIINEMLNVGRSYGISILVISHILCNYQATKNILNECTKVVIFPGAGCDGNYKNYMKRHLGFDKKQVDEILKLDPKTRWLMIDKHYPINLLTQNKAKIL